MEIQGIQIERSEVIGQSDVLTPDFPSPLPHMNDDYVEDE